MSTAALRDRLDQMRQGAAEQFRELGWPTSRQEQWKYTSLAPVQRVGWESAPEGIEADPGDRSFAGEAAAELVFVNGRLDRRLSKFADTPGLRIRVLSEAIEGGLILPPINGSWSAAHPLDALNLANFTGGALIEVTARSVIEGFVHLLFLSEGDGIWSHPRNRIVVGAGAEIAVLETYAGRGRYFTNAVTEVVAAEGAVVEHTRIECESNEAFHISLLQIEQERSSNVVQRSFLFGGALVRNEISASLAGDGASLVLDGLFLGDGPRHIDNHTVIDHRSAHCDSSELYKGILDGTSRGIFDGRIIVRPDAFKTNSRQTNRNLILSESAIVDSKPMLEILNDDVKCSHGSTIGQIDEEAVFYLRSRGIDEKEARSLVVYAFASEIVDRVKSDVVRESLRKMMFGQMAAASGRLENAS